MLNEDSGTLTPSRGAKGLRRSRRPALVHEETAIYRFCRWLARSLWRLIGKLDVVGLENIPTEGPFILIVNHQSILDPVLIQAVCPRAVYAMTKSTQFSTPVVGWLMARHIHAFPVRRYQIDPQAVRYALHVLSIGEPVGIFVEGERSWDGRLQKPRLGSLRLILKSGVQVIPVTVDGTYDVWPRWHHGLRRAAVRVTFGKPLRFPQLDRREDREAALEETGRRIMAALAEQLGKR
jgi:1-acyl-sn-glycerol-3-phosphate acyltransferase